MNASSLKQYLINKFDNKISFYGDEIIDSKLIEEIRNFGINKLKDLDMIIPNDYFAKAEIYLISKSVEGFIRNVLIISDYKKYFDYCWKNNWQVFVSWTWNFLKNYNIPVEEISKKYGITPAY